MNDVFYEEKLADVKEAIDIVFRFQLYRRGKIDEYEDGSKVLGDAIDTLLGCATDYEKIMEENEILKAKNSELEKAYESLWNQSKEAIVEVKNTINPKRKNGENDAQCLDCKDYDKQQGICRWGYCDWYTRKPMAFDGRLCCKTCAFDINSECTYLKEQDKREKERKENKKGTFIEDYMKGKRNEIQT